MLEEDTSFDDFSICTWCNDFLNQPNDNVQDAICSTCIDELGGIPNLAVSNISREFVDNLPFGNIVLDPDYHVIRYNATEAKYTGYDETKIEGKHFFEEVAPCTKVDGFHGKLEEFKEKGNNDQHLFKFTFDHANFKSMVSILLTYYNNGYSILSIKKIREIN